MTRIERINAALQSNAVQQKVEKDEKKEQIISFTLPDGIDYSNKADRKRRKNDLTERYYGINVEYYDERTNDNLTDKLTHDEAEKFAKRQTDNEKRLQKVLDTVSFMDKQEYEAAKKAQKEGTAYQDANLQYIKDPEVRAWVNNNKQKFFEDGKFSSDLYKKELVKWASAGDYQMNIDEKLALSAEGDRMSKGDAKKAAQYAGIDIENDLTWLKKAGTLLGITGAGALIGAGTGALAANKNSFNTYVTGVHADGSKELLGEQHSSSNASRTGAKIGALSGALGALPLAIYEAAKARDNGQKDVFNGSTSEEIVKDPDGILNVTEKDGCRTIVRAILAMPNLTESEKIAAIEYGYGKNTGKVVNKNELIAAYEAAKQLNDRVPENTEPTVPPTPTEPTEAAEPTVAAEATVPTEAPAPTEPTVAAEPEKAPEPVNPLVTVENGESIARIAKKYGVSANDIIELNKDKLHYFKSATNCNDNKKYLGFRVGEQIKLPENANEDAIKKNQETNAKLEREKYAKAAKNYDGKLCPERTKTYRPFAEEFRKKNNIRTKDEV